MNSPFGGTQKRPVAVNPKNKTHERQQPSTKHSQHTDTNSGPGKDCYAGTQNGGEGDTRKRTQSTRHPRPKLKMVPKTPRRFCSDPLEGRGGGEGPRVKIGANGLGLPGITETGPGLLVSGNRGMPTGIPRLVSYASNKQPSSHHYA